MLHAMRVHQWSKNLLVFVPLISSQHYNLAAALAAVAAFFAFSFVASSAYVLNDIVDRETDRHHPAKRNRPFARGDVPVAAGIAMILVFLAIGFAIAFASSWRLAAILAIYLIGTVSYSLVLKRKMLIDVIALAGFYTLRVFGGAVAIAVPVSQWLIIFSIFIFFALAIVKRYSEISIWLETGQTKLIDRDYSGADLPALLALAAAASVSAVVVFALYAQSETTG
jgi:4-hydroxybenzoate polyprenyltransferase